MRRQEIIVMLKIHKYSERVVTTAKRGHYIFLAVNTGNNHKKAQFRNGLRFCFISGLLKVSPILTYLEGKRISAVIKEIAKKSNTIFAYGVVEALSPTDIFLT